MSIEEEDDGVISTDDFEAAQEGGGVPDEAESRANGVAQLMSYLDYHNIAEELDDTLLSEIGERVVREYEIDEESRRGWLTSMESAMKLARQVVEKKNTPWPNSANVKYPLITTASIQFAARAYPAVVPGMNVVKGKVVGSDQGVPKVGPDGVPLLQLQTGEIVPANMAPPDVPAGPVWEVPPGAKRERAGRVARHMSYQLTEEMEEWEEDTDKLLHTLPIVGCVFRKTWYDQLLRRNRSLMILGKDLVVNNGAKSLETAPRITHIFELYPYQIEERMRSGLYTQMEFGPPSEAGEDEDAPHTFLEQKRKWDLDGDGYPEPYIITVHKEEQTIVSIVACFDEEGVEINRETGEIVKIDPVQYYTKYSFIPDPGGGFYDIGFGLLLGPINDTVNSILNALLDAAHLQNTGGGFVRGGFKVSGQSRGKIRIKPGEWVTASAGIGSSLRDSIYSFPTPTPSATLFALLGMLIEAGKEIGAVKDVLTGDQPRRQPATTTLALIEQGLKQFTAIYKRIHRSLKLELRKLYRLNRLYLPDQTYFQVLDEQQAIARQDYSDGIDIVPVSDPSVVTDLQRMAKAEVLMALRADPLINGSEVLVRYLEAAEADDIDRLIMEPQPDPMVIAEFEARGIELQNKTDETRAKVILQAALAMKAMAEAEAAEVGPQLEQYKAQLGLLKPALDRIVERQNELESSVNPRGL